MQPKPDHLASRYAEQFGDAAVASAYRTRPPYPAAVFERIGRLIGAPGARVLELGAGTGDLTFGLARNFLVDAVEPSLAMLEIAAVRASQRVDEAARVRFVHASAEAFESDEKYAAAVAAESLHWMQWEVVMPMLARVLDEAGLLIIVSDRILLKLPWQDPLRELVARHSTNREYRPYEIAHELATRGLFHELGREQVTEPRFVQNVDDYIESFHSRNGFSRQRMGSDAAAAFDRELRALLLDHCQSGLIEAELAATVIWGRPRTA